MVALAVCPDPRARSATRTRFIVRLVNGKRECTLCGGPLDVLTDQAPLVLIAAASGQPNMQIISVDGKEVHRCRLDRERK